MDKPIINIWTDGACSGNPGPGGWGALLVDGQKCTELYGGVADTTNNRMELTAAIQALNALSHPSTVRIHTDSTYVRDGVTKWLTVWKRNGWRTAAKKNVKNKQLWQMLEDACARHDVKWIWVRGHSGNRGNEAADALARMGVVQARSGQ